MRKGMISVVIPMYNAREYVPCMIKSILNQTYSNFEVYIIDDHSTDQSLAVVQEMVSEDNRFHVNSRPKELPKGAQSCRNYGTQCAKGEYLIYLDADDWIAPYCFEQRVAFMEAHDGLDFAVFPMMGFIKKPMDADTILYGYKSDCDDISNLVRRTLPFVVVTNIYRLDFLKENNIKWDIKLRSFQDSDFNLSAIIAEGKYSYSTFKPDYFYRISGNEHSISKRITTSAHAESHIYFFEKQISRLYKNKAYEKDFLVLSDLLFKICSFNMDYNYTKDLLSCSFFLKHPLVRFKLILIAWMKDKMKITNRFFISIFLFILCPIYEFRFRIVYLKWYRYQNKKCKELIDKYNEKVN